MKYGLKQKYIDRINGVLATYPSIDKVLLYGSRAKGTYYNGSDIDLTFFGKTIELSLLMKIENELDDLLLPYKIDASIFNRIEAQDLRDHINRIGVVFYEKKNYSKQLL